MALNAADDQVLLTTDVSNLQTWRSRLSVGALVVRRPRRRERSAAPPGAFTLQDRATRWLCTAIAVGVPHISRFLRQCRKQGCDNSRASRLSLQSQRSSAAPCCSTSGTDATSCVLGRCQGVMAVGETAPDPGFDQSSILLLSREISGEAGVSARASRSARLRW